MSRNNFRISHMCFNLILFYSSLIIPCELRVNIVFFTLNETNRQTTKISVEKSQFVTHVTLIKTIYYTCNVRNPRNKSKIVWCWLKLKVLFELIDGWVSTKIKINFFVCRRKLKRNAKKNFYFHNTPTIICSNRLTQNKATLESRKQIVAFVKRITLMQFIIQ